MLTTLFYHVIYSESCYTQFIASEINDARRHMSGVHLGSVELFCIFRVFFK